MLLISLFQYSFERLLRNIKKKFPVFLLFWRISQRVSTSVFSSVIIVAYSSLALSFIVDFMFPGYFSRYLHSTLEVQTHEVLHFGNLCRIFCFFFNCVTYEAPFITRCLFLLLLHHKCYRFERAFFYSHGFFNLVFLTSTKGFTGSQQFNLEGRRVSCCGSRHSSRLSFFELQSNRQT